MKNVLRTAVLSTVCAVAVAMLGLTPANAAVGNCRMNVDNQKVCGSVTAHLTFTTYVENDASINTNGYVYLFDMTTNDYINHTDAHVGCGPEHLTPGDSDPCKFTYPSSDSGDRVVVIYVRNDGVNDQSDFSHLT